MAKKRKSEATSLEEVDRTMYTTFSSAANALSQLYSQAMNHQKLSFQAGERHAQESLYQWILRQQEEGSRITTSNILAYLQNELDYGGEEPPMSPRPQVQQHMQPTTNMVNPGGIHVSSASFGLLPVGQGPRLGNSDNLIKNSLFSNALLSPVHRNLQHHHQGAFNPITVSRSDDRNFLHNQNRNSSSSDDCFMDIHAGTPDRDSAY